VYVYREDQKEEPEYSDTIQDLEGNILQLCKGKKPNPFIYILDSLDALTSDEEVEREYKNALIRAKQERERIGVTFGKKWTTSGGKAPFYYSTHQVRLNRISTIKSKDRKVGTNVKAEVLKNKLTGKEREGEFKIYYDYGIDDVASCVDFLCKEYWKHPKENGKHKTGSWDAEELGVTGSKATIIDFIEQEGAEKEMKALVGKAWNSIEEELRLDHRKRKYD
jgi:hypothetical protein